MTQFLQLKENLNEEVFVSSSLTLSGFCFFSAEAGGAGQESFKREGAASERAPLPQTPPRAALRVGIHGAHSH